MNVSRPAQDEPVDDLRHLAGAARAGDSAALTALIRATAPFVWRACAALVDRDSADDLTQDTYVRALRSLPTYRGDASPTRWLLAIARRVCAEEIARRQHARDGVRRLAVQPRPTPAGPHHTIEIVEALAALSPDRREAFVLTVLLGLSYVEAAEVCECPVGTIRSRVARARTDLRTASAGHARPAGQAG